MNTLLRTRRSQPVLRVNDDGPNPRNSGRSDPAVQESDRSKRLTTVPTLLFRKVSTFFTSSPEKRDERGRTRIRIRTRSTPLGNFAAGVGIGHTSRNVRPRPGSRYSSRSPSPPSIDIRLPDGLGPRVDDNGEAEYKRNGSREKEEAVSLIPFVKDPLLLTFEEPRLRLDRDLGSELGRGLDRARCLSSPGLLSVARNKSVSQEHSSSEVDSLEFNVPTDENEKTTASLYNVFIPDIPPEIMLLIASFLAPFASSLTPLTPDTQNTPNNDTHDRNHTTSRADLASLARVSKAFLAAARKSLYGTLNFRSIPDEKSEQLSKVLEKKEKKEVAGYVESVILDTWPGWVLGRERDGTQLSLSSLFIKALNNMHALTSLTLPSISPLLPALLPAPTILPVSRPPSRPSSRPPSRSRSHSNLTPRSRLRSRSHSALSSPQHIQQNQPFRLTHLTLLNRTLSHADREKLFEWLRGQVDLVKLEFPLCVDREGDESALGFIATPTLGSSVSIDMSPRNRKNTSSPPYSSSNSNSKRSIRSKRSIPRPRTPTPLYFLPSLTTLHAPPSLILHLSSLRSPAPVPSPSSPTPNSLSSHSRSSPSPKPLSPTFFSPPQPQATPLTRIILPIHTTIYTGLRPTALMRALRGVMELKIIFGKEVDRRSVERVVGAVGDELGFGGRRSEIYGGELGEDGWERRYWDEKDGQQREDGEDHERDGELDSLEIEVAWDGGDTEADESLYRAVQSILPRFRTLQTLRITPAASSRPPAIRRPSPPPPPPPPPPVVPTSAPPRVLAPAKSQPPKSKVKPKVQPQPQQRPHHPQNKTKDKNKPLPPVPLSIQVPFPSLRIKRPPSPSRSSRTSSISGSEADVEAFFTPKEFEFAVEEVKFPPGVRKGGGENGSEVGFHFEIGHRQCGTMGEGRRGKLEHNDYSEEYNQDSYDWDEKQAIHQPEFVHALKQPSFHSLPHLSPPMPLPNYNDCESDRTQLASWLKQCPTLQTVAFLSGAEWCFLAEGTGSGVWINSYD